MIMMQFPEWFNMNQIGRPDDGTDWTGFFDTKYNINLKAPWPRFPRDKELR